MFNTWKNNRVDRQCPILLIDDYLSYHKEKSSTLDYSVYYNSKLADHSTAERLNVFSILIDLIYVESELQRYIDLNNLKREIKYTLSLLSCGDIYRESSNHGFMIDLSIIEFVMRHPSYDSDNYLLKIAEGRIAKQLDAMFDKSGICKEHSISYQEFDCALCIELLNAYTSNGAYSELTLRLQKIIISSYHFLYFCLDKNNQYPKIGDSFPTPNIKSLNLIKAEYEKVPLIIRRFHEFRHNLGYRSGLLFARNAGFSLFKSNTRNINIFFTGSWHSYVHKQNDDLSFTCSIAGIPIIEDPGYSDRINNSDYRHESIHNCHYSPDINWSPRTSVKRNTNLTHFYCGANILATKGVHSRIPGLTIYRTIFLVQDRFVITYDEFHRSPCAKNTIIKTRFNLGSTISCRDTENVISLYNDKFIGAIWSSLSLDIENSQIYNRDGTFTDAQSIVVNIPIESENLTTVIDMDSNIGSSVVSFRHIHDNNFQIKVDAEVINIELKQQLQSLFLHTNEKTDGIHTHGIDSYASVKPIMFSEDSSWRIAISLKEELNNEDFNFFLGERGSAYRSFVRVRDKVYYRASDGSYIGGLPYKPGDVLNLLITYNNGCWVFLDQNNNQIIFNHRDILNINSLGSGYYGNNHEQPTTFYRLIIESSDRLISEIKFNEGFGCIAFDSSGSNNHLTLRNTTWLNLKASNSVIPIKNENDNSHYKNSIDELKSNLTKKFFALEFDAEIYCSCIHKTIDKYISKHNTENAIQFVNSGKITLSRFAETTIEKPITWGENPFLSRSWEWQWHQLIMHPYFISAHAQTNDIAYLHHLKDLVCGWANANYTTNPPSAMAWHDHTTALRLRSLIHIFEYLRRIKYNDDDFLSHLLSMIENHCDILCCEEFYSRHNNHGFDQANILLLASSVFSYLDKSESWRNIACLRIADEIRVAFTSDGMHVENSPSYLVTMTQRLESLRELVNELDIKLNIDLDLLIDSSLNALAYLITPTGKLPIIGDTDCGTNIPSFNSLNALNSYKIFKYSLTKGLLGDKQNSPANLILHIAGYAIFRDAWKDSLDFDKTTQLIFKCGFLSTYHRHDDDLNFTLFAKGEDWIVDGGIYSYDESCKERKYIRSVFSHNVPTIYNTDVRRKLSDSIISSSHMREFNFDCSSPWVKASSSIHHGYVISRKIIQLNPNLYRFEDHIESENDSSFDVATLFHVPCNKNVHINGNQIILTSPNQQSVSITFMQTNNVEINLVVPNDIHLSVRSPTFGVLENIHTLEVVHKKLTNSEKIYFEIQT
ncbi:heparinase II/III domain-containing protein [Aeromonas veronii]|uniref:heparinase II/III domain-containing protein n=1 Tax=Aeromonas veronii TaxID=654 RepID=UPI003D25D8DF